MEAKSVSSKFQEIGEGVYMSKFEVSREDIGKTTTPSMLATGGPEAIGLTKLKPDDIELFLYMHPVMPRGFEIKANRMVKDDYIIKDVGSSDAVDYCHNIIKESGNHRFVKRMVEDSYAFGNGYATLVPNETGDAILKCNVEHPVFFSVSRYSKNDKVVENRGKLKIDDKTKKPMSYSQFRKVTSDNPGENGESIGSLVPVGDELEPSDVAHLVFDTWGDEVLGISQIQYVHTTIKYLLNIENAGAQTMYRNGFVQKMITTNFKTIDEMKDFAKFVTNINEKDSIILPEGVKMENLNPGTTEFDKFHEVFMTLLAVRLGIPKPLLVQDGTSTNKACYSEDTEVLTDGGWKYYWELNNKSKIAQFNIDSKNVEYVNHKGIFTYDVNEEMYLFQNKSVDIFVTDNHRMLFRESRAKEYSVAEAKDIDYRRIKFLASGNWVGKPKNFVVIDGVKNKFKDYKTFNMGLDDYLEFVGYYLSEGGFSSEPLKKGGRKIYNITFAEHNRSKKKIFNFFGMIQEKYGLHIGNYQNNKYDVTHFNLCNQQIWTHLFNQEMGTKCDVKRIPRWILNLSSDKLKILLDSMIYGDGTKGSKKGSFVYYTTSDGLADDFQELAFKCGYSVSKKIHYAKGYGNVNRKKAYRLFLSEREELSFDMKQLKKVKYKGIVWCPSVPSGFFVTRRNNCIAIQGNTLVEQKNDMAGDLLADKLAVEQMINDQIFVPACKKKFGGEFDKFPIFKFGLPEEDKNLMAERLVSQSVFVQNMTKSIMSLIDIDKKEQADSLLDHMMLSVEVMGLTNQDSPSQSVSKVKKAEKGADK